MTWRERLFAKVSGQLDHDAIGSAAAAIKLEGD